MMRIVLLRMLRQEKASSDTLLVGWLLLIIIFSVYGIISLYRRI